MTEAPKKRQRITADLFFEVPSENTNKLDKIESLIDALKSENERLSIKIKSREITHQQALQEKAAKIVELVTQNADIKKQAIYHMDRAEKAADTLATMKAKHTEVANELRDSLSKERQEKESYYELLEARNNEFKQKESEFNRIVDLQEIRNTILNKTNASLVESIESKSDFIKEATQHEKQLTSKLNELQTQMNSKSIYPGNSEPYEVLQEQYKSISERATKLELENQKLGRELKHFKSISQNVELLRREKESLAYQVEELDKTRESKIALETENIKLRLERDAWACYLSSLEVNTQTPQTIISQLTRQVEEARHLQTAVAQFQQQIKDDMLVIEGLTAHIEELKETAAKMQYEHAKDEAAKTVTMKGTEALKRHIAILESQLNMYDQEDIHHGQYDEIKSKRIAELEQLLKDHEQQIVTQAQQLAETSATHVSPVQITNGPYEKLTSGARLTDFLSELMNKQASYMKELQEKSVTLNILQKEYDSATEKVKELNNCLSSQEGGSTTVKQVADTATTTDKEEPQVRILQLVDNPASKDLAIRKSFLERLEKENQDLLQQCLEHTADVALKSSIDNLRAKIQKLEKDLEGRQKHIQRLHTIFENKVQESSTRVRQLFGFTVITRPDDLIRLESPWVDPSELSFLVKLGGDGSSILRMIGSKAEEYRESLYDIYQNYIIVDLNLPAFLNAAAQELYVSFKEKQRMLEERREEVEMEDVTTENHTQEEEEEDEYEMVEPQEHNEDDVDLEYDEEADLYAEQEEEEEDEDEHEEAAIEIASSDDDAIGEDSD